jgi:hypothetical protein
LIIAFVVDAGGFVAEDDQTGLVLGHQAIEGIDVAFVAVFEGGDLDGLVEQETIAGVEGGPIGILADIEGADEGLVVGDAGGELAEGLSAASLNVDQLLLLAGVLTYDTTSFGM